MEKIEQKIEVCRASGMPVDMENMQKFSNEMREAYDKILRRNGYDPDKPKVMEVEDAQRMQKLLDRVERILSRKYPAKDYWEPIVDTEAWKALVDQYGIIMLTKDEVGNLVYVIYDLEL